MSYSESAPKTELSDINFITEQFSTRSAAERDYRRNVSSKQLEGTRGELVMENCLAMKYMSFDSVFDADSEYDIRFLQKLHAGIFRGKPKTHFFLKESSKMLISSFLFPSHKKYTILFSLFYAFK